MKKAVDAKELWDRGIRKSLDDPYDTPPGNDAAGEAAAFRLTWLGKVVLCAIGLVLLFAVAITARWLLF